MRAISNVVALFAAAALCGCTGSLLETELPANALYMLKPAPLATNGAAPLPVDLAIGLPHVAPGLDTDRIAVRKGRQLDYYRAARWGGSTREVVHTFVVAAFEDAHLFRSTTAEQARVAATYVLDIDVRDFQAEYTSASSPTVRVAVIGRLIRVVDRQLVATIAAQAQTAANDNRMQEVAAAFESAMQQVADVLTQKTAAAVAGDETALSAARGTP